MQFIPGGLFMLGVPFLVESPRWLRSRHRQDQALKNLVYLRHIPADHPYLLEEVAMVDASLAIEEQKTDGGLWSNFKELMSRKYRGRMAMCIGLAIFQNLTGINAINVGYACLHRIQLKLMSSAVLLTNSVQPDWNYRNEHWSSYYWDFRHTQMLCIAILVFLPDRQRWTSATLPHRFSRCSNHDVHYHGFAADRSCSRSWSAYR